VDPNERARGVCIDDRPILLSREEVLVLVQALALAPASEADAILRRLAGLIREFETPRWDTPGPGRS
jgi:hypothetical protein